MARRNAADVAVLMNQGDGTLAAPVLYDAGGGPEWVAAADFDGDGMLDLAVTNDAEVDVEASVRVLVNQGDGTFGAAIAVDQGPFLNMVVAADLNGDGEPDLAGTDHENRNVSVLLSLGEGGFAPAVRYGTDEGPAAVAVGDLNGDGKPDLVMPFDWADRIDVLSNQGDGTFVAAGRYGTGMLPAGLVVADLDGDGKNDVATANFAGDSVSLLLNLCPQ